MLLLVSLASGCKIASLAILITKHLHILFNKTVTEYKLLVHDPSKHATINC